MYFEASKKTYYRFPSNQSVNVMDSKNYFPDKPYASGENTRFAGKSEGSSSDRESYAIMK